MTMRITSLVGIALAVLMTGCTVPGSSQDVGDRLDMLQAKVAAYRDAGVKAEGHLDVGPGHAGFPNAAWDSGISGYVHIEADPGSVSEKDLLDHAQFLVDKLLFSQQLGADPGTLTEQEDKLERVMEAIRAARRARSDAPSENEDPVTPTDSGT